MKVPLIVPVLVVIVATITTPANAGPTVGKAVFLYEEPGRAAVHPERVGPMNDGLRAILAMYALQNGAGCVGGKHNLECLLTEELDLDAQCSERHLALVRSWFKRDIPKMSGAGEYRYQDVLKPGSLEILCYRQPDSASFQRMWDMIRVDREGDKLVVYAHGIWVVRESSGGFAYETRYQITDNSIEVLGHEEIRR